MDCYCGMGYIGNTLMYHVHVCHANALKVSILWPVTFADHACIERCEEFEQSLVRVVVALVGVAEPLEGRDTYHSIKSSRSKAQAIPHVPQEQVTFDVSLTSNSCAKFKHKTELRKAFTSASRSPVHIFFLIIIIIKNIYMYQRSHYHKKYYMYRRSHYHEKYLYVPEILVLKSYIYI